MKTLVQLILWFTSIIALISCIIYTVEGDDKWFSRLSLAIICIGLIVVIESKHEKK
jgi:hypothetical protein